MVAITLAVKLLFMNAIGVFVRKSGMVNKEFSSHLTNVILNIFVPCLIFNSINQTTEFSVEALKNCAVVIVLGVLAIALPLLIGHLIYLKTGKSGIGRNIRYGLTFCHFSYMGIPVITELLGELGMFYYTFFLIPVRIGYYALAVQLMTPPDLETEKKSLANILKHTLLSPQLLSVFIGLIFWVGGWHLPEVVDYCVRSLSSVCSPLALLMCGMIVAEYDFKTLLHLKYLRLPVLRTVMMPAVFFLVSRLLLRMGVESVLCQILVIYTALPVPSMLPVYSMKYDPDPNAHLDAAGAGMISVLLSAMTLPIWYMLV